MELKEELIAPCGMNCALCVSYQARENNLRQKGFAKKYCAGCRPRGQNCTFLQKQCARIGSGEIRFCHECANFPCPRLKALDKRYRARYHLSLVENLVMIQARGMDRFLAQEAAQWRCPQCGGMICCHTGLCLSCELEILRRDKKYRWGE